MIDLEFQLRAMTPKRRVPAIFAMLAIASFIVQYLDWQAGNDFGLC
jgi:hypothetical protein